MAANAEATNAEDPNVLEEWPPEWRNAQGKMICQADGCHHRDDLVSYEHTILQGMHAQKICPDCKERFPHARVLKHLYEHQSEEHPVSPKIFTIAGYVASMRRHPEIERSPDVEENIYERLLLKIPPEDMRKLEIIFGEKAGKPVPKDEKEFEDKLWPSDSLRDRASRYSAIEPVDFLIDFLPEIGNTKHQEQDWDTVWTRLTDQYESGEI